MTVEEAKEILQGMKRQVHTDDLETTIRVARENEAIDAAAYSLGLIENREQHFREWAVLNNVSVCATCGRNSDHQKGGFSACPIESCYALPLDGHCHLWEPVKEAEHGTAHENR